MKKFSSLLAAAFLSQVVFVLHASADDRGRMLTLCKAEAKEVLGEGIRVKLHKFKRSRVGNGLYLRAYLDGEFVKYDCEVEGDRAVISDETGILSSQSLVQESTS